MSIVFENNETPSFCAGCGACCRRYAGWYAPEQVLDELNQYKDTGYLNPRYRIDSYDAEESIYVLRPAHLNSPEHDYDPSWGGQCVHLGANGCLLKFEERPLQCQALVATAVKTCSSPLGKAAVAELWKEYQEYFD